MKKVLIAMDNEKLAERVKRTGKYIVENIKKVTKDKVLEYLSENKIDVIVTKDTLVGEGTKEIYLKQVRLLAPESKIVLFANELTESYIEFLANNNITNIIEDENENIYFLELLELIESIYPKIIYKSNKNCYSGFESDNMEVSIKYLPKIFAVYGTSGVGKSYFSSLLSIIASKKNKNNTLLIDMDLSSSAMDIYNNVDKNNDSLMKVMEDIDNETFSPISFMDSISNSKKKFKIIFSSEQFFIFRYSKQIFSDLLQKNI